MDPQPLTIPEWLVTLVGRQVILAEAQRQQDASTIAALQEEVAKLTTAAITPHDEAGE